MPRVSKKSLEEQITEKQQELEKAQKKVDFLQKELDDLVAKKKKARDEKLIRAFDASGKTEEEIFAFLGKSE